MAKGVVSVELIDDLKRSIKKCHLALDDLLVSVRRERGRISGITSAILSKSSRGMEVRTTEAHRDGQATEKCGGETRTWRIDHSWDNWT